MAPPFKAGRSRREAGFSYLVALSALALLAVLSTRALENIRTMEQREREEELLYIGQAYMKAIGQYYSQSPGTVRRYPPDLEALLLDSRAVLVRRPLRRLYRDPIDASTTWGLVEAPDGGIKGVYSLSTRAPFKISGFPSELKSFEGAKSYSEWKFVYTPSQEMKTQ